MLPECLRERLGEGNRPDAVLTLRVADSQYVRDQVNVRKRERLGVRHDRTRGTSSLRRGQLRMRGAASDVSDEEADHD